MSAALASLQSFLPSDPLAAATSPTWTLVGAGAAALAAGVYFLSKPSQPKKFNTKPGVVLLHQFYRPGMMPNLSPFCLKLETFLRIAKIPYEVDSTQPFSYKGKAPWIDVDGQTVADSQFSIEYLTKRFNLDLDSHLSPEETAVKLAFQRMVDEHLNNAYGVARWRGDLKDLNKYFFQFPWLLEQTLGRYLRSTVLDIYYKQGLGRHSDSEVAQVGEEDLKALSEYLAQKKFMFGDRPSSLDAAVFGAIANVYLSPFDVPMKGLIKRYPNLVAFIETVKAEFYPDWEDLSKQGDQVDRCNGY